MGIIITIIAIQTLGCNYCIHLSTPSVMTIGNRMDESAIWEKLHGNSSRNIALGKAKCYFLPKLHS